MVTSIGSLRPEKFSESLATRLTYRRLLESVGISKVFPAHLRLVQPMNEGVTSISQIVQVVEVLHLEN